MSAQRIAEEAFTRHTPTRRRRKVTNHHGHRHQTLLPASATTVALHSPRRRSTSTRPAAGILPLVRHRAVATLSPVRLRGPCRLPLALTHASLWPRASSSHAASARPPHMATTESSAGRHLASHPPLLPSRPALEPTRLLITTAAAGPPSHPVPPPRPHRCSPRSWLLGCLLALRCRAATAAP